ncbi:MAG: molybdopterin cofactor-binding domain-containing protein [Janthinobacterium lividum]
MDRRHADTGAIDRRTLLVTGGAGVGVLVGWAVWPRAYRATLTAAPGETILSAWLKIAEDGVVTVAVPQAEHGQGAWTALAQIVADELGADWRTVGVEAAPPNPLYANPLALDELLDGALGALPHGLVARHAVSADWMLTGGSTSVRMFEGACRRAGAGARALLCRAAARRWGVDWRACDTHAGFVVQGGRRLRFGEIAAAAAGESLPDPPVLRVPDGSRLSGKSLPRLDVPAKVDGSAQFAADIRLPDMVFASVRSGPVGDTRLVRSDTAAANRIRGVLEVVEAPGWIAAVATDWWAADRALDALAPRFATRGPVVTTASIDAALEAALAGPGERMVATGDVAGQFRAAHLIAATYRVAPGVHASIETAAATARWHDGRLELWLPTQAPAQVRAAAAAAIGVAPSRVTVHPMLIGGSFGAALETGAAAQAAVLAMRLKRPVQVTWSRAEDLRRDAVRAPALARMAARLGPSGQIAAWEARIAAPATGRALARRLFPGDRTVAAALALSGTGDRYAVAGAEPAYRIPAIAIDHHPADSDGLRGLTTGHLRGGAHGYTCFFTESFVDELAHAAGTEALSYRIAMLGGDPRLARCLSTAASLGGWDGGGPGSGQGIAAHAFRGSRIAVLAEARIEGGRIRVDRLVAAVDCGRAINPDLVRQQIEGGLIFGMAQALGASTGYTAGLPDAHGFGGLGLPRLADVPDVTVELIRSEAEPGGVGELAVPPVAPAIANALWSATGTRLRSLPLIPGTA